MTNRLPERKEDDQLDTQHLHERPMFGEIFAQLDIKLNQAKHGNSHTRALEDECPDVRE